MPRNEPPYLPAMPETFRIGITGVSGYGGGEALRLCLGHPNFEVVRVYGEGSAGKLLRDLYPQWAGAVPDLTVETFDPAADLDLLFASLPTGMSKAALADVPEKVKVVDIGGDHRHVEGWTYGLADADPAAVRGATRVANPGCFPSAALAALMPLRGRFAGTVVIDAKTGVSGAGRGGGGGGGLGFGDANENVKPYKIGTHAHQPEIATALDADVLFVPHLVPMTRGILATCYAPTDATANEAADLARDLYRDSPFVHVTADAAQSKWPTASNHAFVSYHRTEVGGHLVAVGAVDNLGKGAAGQAVQNANLMLGLSPGTGLSALPPWP